MICKVVPAAGRSLKKKSRAQLGPARNGARETEQYFVVGGGFLLLNFVVG
jgi:hypothetical protein